MKPDRSRYRGLTKTAPDADLTRYDKWELDALETRLAQCARCPAHGGACDGDTTPGAYPCGERVTGSNAGALVVEPCDRWREHELREWLGIVGVPPLLQSARLRDFDTRTPNRALASKAATEFLERTLGRPDRPLALQLHGRTGSGKSHLAAAVTAALHRRRRVAFVYVPALIDRIRAVIDHRPGAQFALERTATAPVLVLDDLGAERPTDFVREKLEAIIHERVYRMQPFVVTSNLDPSELGNRIGEEATRRLGDASEGLRVMLDQRPPRGAE